MFDMAVYKRKVPALIMSIGRYIPPDILLDIRTDGRIAEFCVYNRVRALIDENKQLARCGMADFGVLRTSREPVKLAGPLRVAVY